MLFSSASYANECPFINGHEESACNDDDACMTRDIDCEFTLSPEASEEDCNEISEVLATCDFFIAQAIALPGGGYKICVQAVMPGGIQQWTISQGSGAPISGIGCWDLPAGSNEFEITHTCCGGQTCKLRISIATSGCPENAVTAEVVNCDNLDTELSINLSQIPTPYAITFGGFPVPNAVQSSAPQVSYPFYTEGTYDICLTYETPNGYVTCCYPVDISDNTNVHCGFLITHAECTSTGYQICVQADDQNTTHNWNVVNGVGNSAMVVATGSNANQCWPINNATSSYFQIFHEVAPSPQGGCYECLETIFIGCEPACTTNLTSVVENCELLTTISLDLPSVSTPYVIDFGDGSLAQQQSTGTITHTFPQPGTYEVCLTYQAIEYLVTCCYPMVIKIPEGCTCSGDNIDLIYVEPCTWLTTLQFDLPVGVFPITVDYGDGSAPEVVTGPIVTHDFPDNLSYNVCYTFEPIPGSILTCCEVVSLPQCCLDASFTMAPDYENGWASCYNPAYVITPTGCLNPPFPVTHIWEFSDGTVFNGPFPPNHIFTNFVDAEGEVCVTHTIICCDETATAEVCVPHFPAAYIGTPGGETNLTDIIPTTGQTVLQFIQQNANNPSLPLLIDGQLNIDIDGIFNGGIWNMGRNSEIVVWGKNPFFTRTFRLTGTTIRSAVRHSSTFAACCRWIGIRSQGRTYIDMNGATVMDANYAVHYPALTATGISIPRLRSVNTTYENNYYAIKSFQQRVVFPRFQGNILNGTTLPVHVCGCLAVNAIDFRNVAGATQNIRIDDFSQGTNEIFNYERGFNFENTRLTARGFNIHRLREYDEGILPVPVNPDGQTAIGIDFLWTMNLNSQLDIDRISFTDFEELGTLSYAVRDRVRRGNHTLRADASTFGGINTAGVAGGYDIAITSPGRMVNSVIRDNSINTDGSNDNGVGFGITGFFNLGNTSGNLLTIADNTINVATGAINNLNGGILLSSPDGLHQPFNIFDNNINVLLFQGVGISITGAENYCVRRNILTTPAPITGIELNGGGGGSTIECNIISDKTLGMNVLQSTANFYSGNDFEGNNNDMHFSGDNMGGGNGSLIQWNTFEDSEGPSLIYDIDAFTGAQLHNQYNSWTERNGVEVQHANQNSNSDDVLNSRFHRPSNVGVNTIHFPLRTPSGMMTFGSSIIEPEPAALCSPNTGCFAMFQEPNPDPEEDYAAIVQDATFLSGLTVAQKTSLQQGIYGLLLDNPTWLSSSSALSVFKAAQDASFVGQSETLRHAWLQLMDDISAHQATLAPAYDTLDALSLQLQQWFDAIAADSSLEASLQSQINAAIQQGEALSTQLQLAEDQYAPTVLANIAQLQSQNAALEDTATSYWYEKRYNEIALHLLAGIDPDSAATADLRTIAQTCLMDGGRSVLSARGLCSVWLKEYYSESNCQSLQQRSDDGDNLEESAPDLRIVPNPADDLVRISLMGNNFGGQQVQVFSPDGRLVFFDKLPAEGELVISVKEWSDGLYIAKITSDSTIFTRSFVVQH